jgi:YVTN family beta-propeller protein
LLLLHANESVSRDRLIEAIWGATPPPTAVRSLDSYVSRLRALLGGDRIERRSTGYAIQVENGELDLERFEALLDEGRTRLADGDAPGARDVIRRALALWRGPPLADLLFADAEAGRLGERRMLAFETLAEVELELGCGADIAAQLEGVVADNPFRERLVGQLMTALYQAGRQSEALASYQSARRRFANELGLELSPQLHHLEQQILNHDPRLAPRAARPRAPTRRPPGRRLAVVLLLVLVVVGGSAALFVAVGGSSRAPLVELRGLVDTPAAMAVGRSSVWVAEPNAGAVVAVDIASRRVVQRVPLPGSPGAVAVGGGAVWVAGVPGGSISRIDPKTGIKTQMISLGGAQVSALAYGGGLVWAADATDRTLIALDAASGATRRTYELLVKPTAIAVRKGMVWVADYDAGVVTAIDARTGVTTATARVGNGPAALAVGAGAVWVANSLDATVSKVDVPTGAVAATVAVGSYPIALAIADRSVWVANEYSASVSRIDTRTVAVVHTTSVDGLPTSLVRLGDRVWIGTRRVERRTGGTLRLLHTPPLSIDPDVYV